MLNKQKVIILLKVSKEERNINTIVIICKCANCIFNLEGECQQIKIDIDHAGRCAALQEIPPKLIKVK